MIIYYSLSGNTAYIAKSIAQTLDDQAVDAAQQAKERRTEFYSEKPFVFCSPVFYMNAPFEFVDYLKSCTFSGCDQAYIALSASYSAGNAKADIIAVLKEKGLKVVLVTVFYPPTSKIIGLTYPNEISAKKRVARLNMEVLHFATLLKNMQPISHVGSSLFGLIGTAIGKQLQKGQSDKKFRANEKCIACGKCADVCPRRNIELKEGKPIFMGNCNHCSACVNICPERALDYGNRLKDRLSYSLDELSKEQ